jgi:SAM-dependent methyltransferase
MADQGDRVKPAVAGFDSAATAGSYERARPSYPAEAIAYVVGRGAIGPGCEVLDLGAGTGKLTRLLLPTGAAISALEPVAAMREQLVAGAPEVDVRDGTAEALPYGDAAFDVVTIAQAFHWFDPPTALAEIRRVLRPGGRLFLLWNVRDRRVPWVARMGDVMSEDGKLERPYDSYHDIEYGQVIAESSRDFGPVERWSHDWAQPCDEELLVDRAASVSVVGQLPEDRRAAVLDNVRQLARTHPDLAGKAWFDFPYTTVAWRCEAI